MKALLLASLIFVGCAAPEAKRHYVYSEAQNKKENAKEEFSKIYELSKTPDYELERKFEELLEQASAKILAASSYYFSYSLSPYGAVYPFSSVKVNCLFSGSFSKADAKRTCDDFFKEVDIKLSLIK